MARGRLLPGEAQEILLYALADGSVPAGKLGGQCEGGRWTGEALKPSARPYVVSADMIGKDHPKTLLGSLDNWHIHYNLCIGGDIGHDSQLPEGECEAQGGVGRRRSAG